MSFANVKAAFVDAFPVHARGLFDDLIWPAAAGNVAWSFLQVAMDSEANSRVLRLALLMFLAFYLAIDWFRSKSLEPKTLRYWVADSIHIACIVTYGVAIAVGKSAIFLEYNLATIFGIAVIGHLAGAWEIAGQTRDWLHRVILASCGVVGLAILWFGRTGSRSGSLRAPLFAFVVVLILWVFARTFIASRCEVSAACAENERQSKSSDGDISGSAGTLVPPNSP